MLLQQSPFELTPLFDHVNFELIVLHPERLR
jgi:hypothetical protein